MPFDTSCAFDVHGRPAMIFSAVTSPTPGSFISSSLLAELRSSIAPAAIAGFPPLVVVLADVAGVEVPADMLEVAAGLAIVAGFAVAAGLADAAAAGLAVSSARAWVAAASGARPMARTTADRMNRD